MRKSLLLPIVTLALMFASAIQTYSQTKIEPIENPLVTTPIEKVTSANSDENAVVYSFKDQWGTNYQLSDAHLKENVKQIDSALAKILRLRGVSYNFINNSGKDQPVKIQLGYIAQELEVVLPTLVSHSGTTSYISYTELIPVITEAFKDLNSKVLLLRSEVDYLTSIMQKQGLVSVPGETHTNSILYQNQPNPFNAKTEIRYNIDNTAGTASINIYNLQGLELKSYTISAKGNGSITVNSSELSAGMYYYTLIVDGVEIDTKKMILTN